MLSCGHIFCGGCLAACFVKTPETCPTCRQTVSKPYRACVAKSFNRSEHLELIRPSHSLVLEPIVEKWFERSLALLAASGKAGEAQAARSERAARLKCVCFSRGRAARVLMMAFCFLQSPRDCPHRRECAAACSSRIAHAPPLGRCPAAPAQCDMALTAVQYLCSCPVPCSIDSLSSRARPSFDCFLPRALPRRPSAPRLATPRSFLCLVRRAPAFPLHARPKTLSPPP